MNKLFKELSSHLYNRFFTKRFKEKEWKMGHIVKQLEEETQEVLYIGARFEDRYWLKKETLKNHHFYLRILKGRDCQGDTYSIFFHEKNAKIPEKDLIKEILEVLQEKKADILLHIIGYGEKNRLYATGQKSKYVLSLIEELKSFDGMNEYNEWTDEFRYSFGTCLYKLKTDTPRNQLKIAVQDHDIAVFSTIDEVRYWNEKQQEEQKEIDVIWEKAVEIIQKKTKSITVPLKRDQYIRVDGKYAIEMSIEKTYRNGKAKFFVTFLNEKENVLTIKNAEEKVKEYALKFSYSYRIRKLVGNK